MNPDQKKHPQTIILHKEIEHADLAQLFRWDYPNWGWCFLGILIGVVLTLVLSALCRRLGGG